LESSGSLAGTKAFTSLTGLGSILVS
jgi:hypothetical protein